MQLFGLIVLLIACSWTSSALAVCEAQRQAYSSDANNAPAFIDCLEKFVADQTVASATAVDDVANSKKVLIIDGETTSYGGDVPNWQAIESLIRGWNSEVQVEHLSLVTTAGQPIVQPSHILARKADVIIFHWSSFGSSRDGTYCRPMEIGQWRECASNLLSLLQQVFKQAPNTIFVGYSRADNLCVPAFQSAVAILLERAAAKPFFTSRTQLISMAPGSVRTSDFTSEKAQRDWFRLLDPALRGELPEFGRVDTKSGLCRLGR